MPKLWRALFRGANLSLLLIGAGCAISPSQEPWGQHASFRVGWERTAEAAREAAKSPAVWAPLAGAAALQINNWDHQVSDWAVDHTPIFGSTHNAHKVTDDLQTIAGIGTVTSWLAIPAAGGWDAKLKGAAVELGAIGADSLLTEGLKRTADRSRPNGGDNSFPSGHVSFVSLADTLTIRNLDALPLGSGSRMALTAGANALTVATAWGRVEAGAHYPSDVLVGMAIGNFFGRFFTDAFLGDELSRRLDISFQPSGGGAALTWNWRF